MTFFTKRFHPPGTPPGTLTVVPEAESAAPHIHLIDYNATDITIYDDVAASDCRPFLQRDSITWVHVQGQVTEALLNELGDIFQLHSLALEDVSNRGQRPKIEAYDDQLFGIMSLPLMEADIIKVQQVSFFLSSTFLVSFCEGDSATFEPVIKRLQDNGSRLRSHGADFLLYSLLDIIIDQGFPVLESFGMQLEEMEDQILEAADNETLSNIHLVKRELILLRRMLWPQREVINKLLHNEHKLVQENTLIYLRDCYDHTIQVMDLLETYRDMTASMLDIYLSNISNRMNEIMKVLTVISTIFIPLTFITGVYGMNFDRTASSWSMPELSWPLGYLLVWFAMLSIAALMLVFFRRRGWI